MIFPLNTSAAASVAAPTTADILAAMEKLKSIPRPVSDAILSASMLVKLQKEFRQVDSPPSLADRFCGIRLHVYASAEERDELIKKARDSKRGKWIEIVGDALVDWIQADLPDSPYLLPDILDK